MTMHPRIVIVGGGFGGLETAFYLRSRLHDSADITLISDRDSFIFKPQTIYIPFGAEPETLHIKLNKPLQRKQITFIGARVCGVDPLSRHVDLLNGQRLPYDFLILATGANTRPGEIPGLVTHAHSIWTEQDMLRLRSAFNVLLSNLRREVAQQVLFVLPPNNRCATPLYEMALMLDAWLVRHKVRERATITWTTAEHSYLEMFGSGLHAAVLGEFTRRGIMHYSQHVVESIGAETVRYSNAVTLPFDLLVTFPPQIAATPFDGLPTDERGYLRTDLRSGQVVGHPEIYAVGDSTSFPIKQAHLAFMQADAAAEHLSAQILGGQPQFVFEPVSFALLEGLQNATFAQVPLHVEGQPVTDSPMYRTGTSPLWRLGKQVVGAYLPWRFNAGEPFYSGLPWKGIETSLQALSGLFAQSPS